MPTPLLERDREMTRLQELVAAADAGEGGVALIEGPAGIGKSRLLAEVRGQARARFQVLSARGSELERDFPFGSVRQLFEPPLRDAERRRRVLSGAAAPAAAVFEPLTGEAEDGASFATLHGLLWLTLNLAEERPLVLEVDDLQWCDSPSLRFLAFLARRLEGVPVLVAATLRNTDPGTDPMLVAEIASGPFTTSVQPGPLGRGSVESVIAERLGPDGHPTFTAAVEQATGGNPLLVDQLMGALAADGVKPEPSQADLVRQIGPRAVSRTVASRLTRLGSDAQAVAKAVAVLEGGAQPEAIAALTGLQRSAVSDAVRALTEVELLRAESPLSFTHPLIRDAVYEQLSPVERAPSHALAARVLRAAGAPPDQVAAQLMATPPAGEAWAGRLLWDVGRSATQTGAVEAAVPYFTRALEEPLAQEDRPGLLLELGRAEMTAVRPEAAEHLGRAFETLAAPEQRAQAAMMLARWLMFTDDSQELDRLLSRVRAELPEELGDAGLQFEALAAFGAFHGFAPRESLERARAHRVLPADPTLGDLMFAGVAAHDWTLRGGSADETSTLALAATEDGRLMEADNTTVAYAPMVALLYGDRDELIGRLDHSREVTRRSGSWREVYSEHSWRGLAMLHRGELDEALLELDAARDALQLVAMSAMAAAYLEGYGVMIHLARGEVAAARSWLASPAVIPPATDAGRVRANAELELLLAEGRHDQAVAKADAWAEAYGAFVSNPVHGRWRSVKARALAALGAREEALELAGAELDAARAFGSPTAVGYSARVLGELRGQEGIDLLEEAVEATRGTPARLEHARSQFALGRSLRLARRPADSREPLQTALEFAAAHGADGLAARARDELAAGGTRPRRDVFSGADALTPSERRIVERAAAGASNREIAQELYVTPKTVEVHLSNSYRKLGVRSRKELPTLE